MNHSEPSKKIKLLVFIAIVFGFCLEATKSKIYNKETKRKEE